MAEAPTLPGVVLDQFDFPEVESFRLRSGERWKFRNKLVRDEASLAAMRDELLAHEQGSYDTETSGLHPHLGARICGHAFTVLGGERELHNFYVPVRHQRDQPGQLPPALVAAMLREVVARWKWLRGHHVKFDALMARAEEVELSCGWIDTALEAVIDDENEYRFGLKPLSGRHLLAGADKEESALDDWLRKDARQLGLRYKDRKREDDDVLGEPTYLERFGYARSPIELCGIYACHDGALAWLLHEFYVPRIYPRFAALYRREVEVARELLDLEWQGLPVNVQTIHEAAQLTQEETAYWRSEIVRMVGHEIATDPDSLRALLYQECGMVPIKLTKGGDNSADKASRKLLAKQYPKWAPLLRAIDRLVAVEKLHSTYAGSWLKYVTPAGRVHSSYNQLEQRDEEGIPKTGRMACVAEWTPVRTQHGLLPIREVKVGDLVWTHRGRWREVSATYRKGVEAMVDVHLGNGNIVTCTMSHRLLRTDGQWVSAQELAANGGLKVGEESGGQPRSGSAGALPVERASHDDCDRAADEAHLPQRIVHSEHLHAGGGATSAGQGSLLRVEAGQEESAERQAGCELEGGMRRRLRVSDLPAQGEAGLRAPTRDGEGAGASGTASPVCSASHRWQSEEQRVGQSSTSHRRRAQGCALYAGEGREGCGVEEVTSCGSYEVFDLSVAEDESYEACGVYHHNSTDPNAQNIAKKPAHLHTCCCEKCFKDNGLSLGEERSVSIRRYYTVPKGFVRVFIDLSQIEVRVLAWLTQARGLLYCYARDLDIHQQVADAVCEGKRDIGKIVVLATQYGITEHGLAPRLPNYAEDPDAALADAQRFLYMYDQAYPEVKQFENRLVAQMCANKGMFISPFGRPRRIYDVYSDERAVQAKARRKAMSSMISGSSADILKEIIRRNRDLLREAYGHLPRERRGLFVQTIHDENVYDLPIQGCAQVIPALHANFCRWPEIEQAGVPIRASIEISTTTWEDKRPLKPMPGGAFQLG